MRIKKLILPLSLSFYLFSNSFGMEEDQNISGRDIEEICLKKEGSTSHIFDYLPIEIVDMIFQLIIPSKLLYEEELTSENFVEFNENYKTYKNAQGEEIGTICTYLCWDSNSILGEIYHIKEIFKICLVCKEFAAIVKLLWPSAQNTLKNLRIGFAPVFADLDDILKKSCSLNNGLHVAVLNGYANIIKYLLTNGSNVNEKNAKGETLLYSAVCSYKWNSRAKKIIELLIERGANIDEGDEWGESPLCCIVRACIFRKDVQKNLDMVKFLIDKGASVNAVGKLGIAVFYHAIEQGHEDLMEVMINGGADVNSMMWESYGCVRLDRIQELLKKKGREITRTNIGEGTDIDTKNKSVQTPGGCGLW